MLNFQTSMVLNFDVIKDSTLYHRNEPIFNHIFANSHNSHVISRNFLRDDDDVIHCNTEKRLSRNAQIYPPQLRAASELRRRNSTVG